MTPYLDLLRHVRHHGSRKEDRTGTGTLSVFGHQMRFDLAAGFPAVTTKKLFFKAIVHELIWFLRGDTNIRYLVDNGVKIWSDWPHKAYVDATGDDIDVRAFEQRVRDDDAFAAKWGDCGPIYGRQWRAWKSASGQPPVDQLAWVVQQIREKPDSRRHIVSAWNPEDIADMVLPPCHAMFQFYVADGRLSCQLYQRSADIFLGVPFNIASYAILTHVVAQCCDLQVGDFVHTLGDAHLYLNHLEQADTQLDRDPLPLPQLHIAAHVREVDQLTYDDVRIEGYTSHGRLAAPIAV